MKFLEELTLGEFVVLVLLFTGLLWFLILTIGFEVRVSIIEWQGRTPRKAPADLR